MATVIVSIATKEQIFPGNTIGGKYAYDLMSGDNSIMHQESDQLSVSFVDVLPGTYSARAQRMDSAGKGIGDAVSNSFDVPEPTVILEVPETLTVTLA